MKMIVRSALLALSLPLLAVACTTATDEEVVTTTDAIVGGTEAVPGEHPAMASLYKGATASRPSCGGSLIAPQWVVTAAHCVSTVQPTGGVSKVVINRHKLSVTTTGETRTVDKVIRHARYGSSDNDIALLHLSEASTVTPMKVIAQAELAAIATGAMTTTIGFGATSQGGPSSDVLRTVDVPVIDNTACKGMSGYSRVSDNMICAGYATGALDSCQGDSGGPLLIKVDGAWREIGLVSWGIGCARPNQPGVYTRLGNYLAWMHEQTLGEAGEAPATVTPPPPPAGQAPPVATAPPPAAE